jgi:hypothetical protein
MEFAIKNFKPHRGGMEGGAYTATLYVDGKRAAFVSEQGDGGELEVDWTPGDKTRWDGPLCKKVDAYLLSLPYESYQGVSYPVTLNVVIARLVSAIEKEQAEEKERKIILKRCSTEVVFRVPGGPWRTIKTRYTKTVQEVIRARHGTEVIFANETIAGQVPT